MGNDLFDTKNLLRSLNNLFHINIEDAFGKLVSKKKNKKSKKEKKKNRGGFSLRLTKQGLLGAFDATIFIGLIISSFFVAVYILTPTPNLDERKVNQATVIYDRTGEHELYKIHGEENRKIIPPEEIPETIKISTLAAEDDTFYKHIGIDPSSMIRAAKVNFESGNISQGGSTITQQLARNAFLTRDRNWNRKIREIILALKIERKYTKEEIFTHYLNEVPYGSNAYGIQAASKIFFDKDAQNLTLDEAAFLAALPKATSYYSPYGNHKDALVARQKNILNRIGELGFADWTEVQEALKIDTLGKLVAFNEPIDSPHFVMYVREELEKMFGQEMVETEGFKIYTTLDYDMQKEAERLVKEGAFQNKAKYNAENAALVAIDVKTGEVLAMVGSRDYFDTEIDGQVNVTMRPRSPGSSFKPIVYAKAFEKGFQPETVLFDVVTNFGPDGSGKNYIPQNYDGKTHGLVSMREALGMSLNIPAVKTIYLAGVDETIELARRLGIESVSENRDYGLSLAIGGGEVTLLEEMGAYTVFASEGYKKEITGIHKIVDAEGKTFENNGKKSEQVLHAEVARKINSILSDRGPRVRTFGPNSNLEVPGKTVAVKTGTTQEYRDAWTVGYTPSIAVGVWTGNNDNSVMTPGSYGALVAGSIWNKFMRYSLESREDEKFAEYQRVQSNNYMVTGNFDKKISYYSKTSGKELSESKAKKKDPDKVREKAEPEKHSILHYVNQDDPLGETKPDYNDPMVARWEKAIREHSEEDKDLLLDLTGLFGL